MVDNKEILLVAFACLDCPVEGSGYQMGVINDCKFVVHVVDCIVISSHWDALLGQPLDIVALVVHALIIRNYTDSHSTLVGIMQSIC